MAIDMGILSDLLAAQIKDTGCTCFACMVTPELAQKLLDINIPNNRPIRAERVKNMANDIKAGRFTLSPNPICIDTNGRMSDGEHRCSAIVMADTPAPLYIMVGVQPDSIIDRGLVRKPGDSLYMRGVIDKSMAQNNVIATATRYLIISGNATTKMSMTDSVLADFLTKYGNEAVDAVRISSLGGKGAAAKKAGVQAAIMAALMNSVPEETLECFAKIVNTGYYDSDKQTAAILLRNYILKGLYGSLSGKQSNLLCALSQMCIQDFVEGKPRKQMYRTLKHVYINGKEEAFPKAA